MVPQRHARVASAARQDGRCTRIARDGSSPANQKGAAVVPRRTVLNAMAGAGFAAAGGLATPAVSQRAGARTLRFVPQADLANFDPVWTTTIVARNASVLVWDTLYGID